jgi:homoaconitase/3-isopropylmalate dehydratase large subunit
MAVEFHGDIENLSMDERFTIANMGIEMGAKIAVFPVDKVTEEYMASHKSDIEGELLNSIQFKKELWADESATYIKELEYDLSIRVPQVACPHAVDNVKPAQELSHIEIQQCLVGTCTNGRVSDFEAAAKVLKGKKIHESVRLLIVPASKTIMMKAMAKGYIADLMDAGAIVLPAGCGPCLGAHQGCLAPEEKCLSTANRNFKGRMGCKDAEIYLASPETVAISALTGRITDPRKERS